MKQRRKYLLAVGVLVACLGLTAPLKFHAQIDSPIVDFNYVVNFPLVEQVTTWAFTNIIELVRN